MKNGIRTDNTDVIANACKKITELEEQLEQAKEILREYIRINLLPPIERYFDDEVKLFKQAEQFLKENDNG